MKLTATKRVEETKGAVKQARRLGKIPAVFYADGKPGLPIEVDGAQFSAAIRTVKKNHLSTTVFSLEIDGKEQKMIVKGIQYDRINYDVIHLDFEGLDDNRLVKINVPIEFTGINDCVGIKLGGNLRQVIRNVKVKCLPKNIPSEFVIDVRELKMRQSKKLSDIEMPEGVVPIAKADEVVVVIAKR